MSKHLLLIFIAAVALCSCTTRGNDAMTKATNLPSGSNNGVNRRPYLSFRGRQATAPIQTIRKRPFTGQNKRGSGAIRLKCALLFALPMIVSNLSFRAVFGEKSRPARYLALLPGRRDSSGALGMTCMGKGSFDESETERQQSEKAGQ